MVLIEDCVHQMRASSELRALIWCPSGGRATREAEGTVAESLVGRSSALLGEYTPDSAREEGSSIFDEPEMHLTPVRENRRRELGGF